MNFANDIPYDTARAAHYGTSFVPEKRAEQEREDHAATLQADFDSLSAEADTDEKRLLLEGELDFCGRYGFPDYELTNNNANIRRMKARVATISDAQAKPSTETEGNGITLEDNPAENRVRLFFPGKPSADVRTKLKGGGFRWTPTLGCWQAYRNWRTLEIANAFVSTIALDTN